MPELPEVETIVHGLKASNLIGKKILKAETRLPKMISPSNLGSLIKGQTILNIFRRAKFIVVQLKDFHLLIHLRMTGHLFLTKPILNQSTFAKSKKNIKIKTTTNSLNFKPKKHEHIQIELDDGRVLIYEDVRRFGKFVLIKDKKEVDKILQKLGPEPLDQTFTFELFFKKLKLKKSKIKPLLLDQQFLAGLGNIYANEALFLAQIHPEKIACKISKKTALKLFVAIRAVLKEGIKNKGTSLGENYLHFSDLENHFGKHQNFLKVHDRKNEKCLVCKKTQIIKKQIAQRSAYFCPQCQKA